MRIGIYGGGFNPPHISHVLAAVYAKLMARLDHLMILPCHDHAFEKRAELAPFADRLAMCKLAFAGHQGISVDDFEAHAQSRYTIDLIEKLRPFYGIPNSGNQLVLIVGADNAADMAKWHRWDELREMVELFPIGRGGVGDAGTGIAMPEVSSTSIRKNITKENWGEVLPFLPPAVVTYIRGHHLYVS